MNENTRKISLSWKTDKNTKIKRDSVSFDVSTSPVEFAMQNDGFIPFIKSYLEGVQDKLARQLIEAGKPIVQVQNSLTTEAMLDYLVTDAESGRLTKEDIALWFDTTLSDKLTVAISDVLGIGDIPTDTQVKTLQAAIDGHKAKLTALAGGATSYAPAIAAKLQKAVELVGNEDATAARFIKRLEKMQKHDDAEMLGL